MLNIESISKGFGDQILFDNTGFQINPGEKIGLVGRNGHGKTTMLNIIIGTEHPDDGKIVYPSGYSIALLTQKIEFSKPSVIEEAMQGLLHNEKNHYWKVEKILAGLGFSNKDMKKDPMLFSGGYQVRLNLAKLLVSEPNLLILDEPTNYLDITSIRWITTFLKEWARELLIVTHNRGFMDQIITHVVGIHRHKIRKIKGDTAKYYSQIDQEEAIYEKTRQNEEKRQKRIEEFITHFRAKARLANLVQSRIKTLEKTQVGEKLLPLKNLSFSFNYQEFIGKQVMMVRKLNFSWEHNNNLIHNFSLVVYPYDKIAVVGKNGTGKTTLLKLLSQTLAPLSGELTINPGVSIGYFEQTNIQSLNEGLTIEEELINAHPYFDRQTARNICGAMMFEQNMALKKIAVLSGGEKARVMLGKLLVRPLNLLLLDEPTNHFDIESCDAFASALKIFPGAVIFVTHNEFFLHYLANRLIIFKSNGISIFEGTYQEFLEQEGWEDESHCVNKKNNIATVNKKELRRLKSQIIARRAKILGPIQKKIIKIEDEIEKKEIISKSLSERIMEASIEQNGTKIQDLSKNLAMIESEIETLFQKLEKLMYEQEAMQHKFEQELILLEKGDNILNG